MLRNVAPALGCHYHAYGKVPCDQFQVPALPCERVARLCLKALSKMGLTFLD